MLVSKSNSLLFALASLAAIATFVMTAQAGEKPGKTPLPAPELGVELSTRPMVAVSSAIVGLAT